MHLDDIPEHLFAFGIVAVLALYYGTTSFFLSLDVWE